MTASRALLRDLQAAFWADVPERKTRKSVVMPATQLEHHEPAPKLEVLGPVKIDRRVWVSSTRGHERPRRLAVVAGARQVSRPGCDPAARGRSVRSCTGSPSPEGRPRPPRSRGSVAGSAGPGASAEPDAGAAGLPAPAAPAAGRESGSRGWPGNAARVVQLAGRGLHAGWAMPPAAVAPASVTRPPPVLPVPADREHDELHPVLIPPPAA